MKKTSLQSLRRPPRWLITVIVLLTLMAGLVGALTWGGPKDIAPLASINNPFQGLDYSTLPPAQQYAARDGTALAWRSYSPAQSADGAATRRVVLIYGSSAHGRSMHVLAQALAAEGYAVAALDMRGHGASDPGGQVAYVGQLEDEFAL